RRELLPEAEPLDEFAEPIGAKLHPDLDRGDVARFDQKFREGEDSVVLGIVNDTGTDVDRARPRIDDVVDRPDVFFERRRRRDDLERGPGLVHILDGTVAAG